MPLFRKKADPISARSKELESQISALQTQIHQLSNKIETPPRTAKTSHSQPRVRSTAKPNEPTVVPPRPPPAAIREPVFEQLDYQKSKVPPEIESSSDRYNDLGVRKYDIFGAFRRLKNHFRGTPTSNPKLVSYLAAGSIKGLRPLRYEKRIARNRFIFLSIFFALILWGVIMAINK